ncbi:MAG: GGDEF domain-containing protein [Lachnospiraceae bacterium]|nr:GGDEF domain-containing protein [Lachnospiraceae bacterium]
MHSSLATVILGWPAGFQLWLLALSCAYFFPTLVFEEYINPEKLSWFLTGLSAATFFVLLFHSRFGSDALMSDIILSGEVYFYFHLFNCVVTYFVVMFFSAMFVKGMISTANKLSEYANFDNTTGLYNRNGLGEILKTRSFEGDEYSISIMDIDDFKSINDTYGHKAGDAALKYVGTLLNELIDEDRALCRWGGDEFLFVQTGKNSFEQLYDTLEKLRIEIENSNIVVGDTIFHITISAGVAKGDKNFDMDEALECADRVLYQSKANGKNCIKKLEG